MCCKMTEYYDLIQFAYRNRAVNIDINELHCVKHVTTDYKEYKYKDTLCGIKNIVWIEDFFYLQRICPKSDFWHIRYKNDRPICKKCLEKIPSNILVAEFI